MPAQFFEVIAGWHAQIPIHGRIVDQLELTEQTGLQF